MGMWRTIRLSGVRLFSARPNISFAEHKVDQAHKRGGVHQRKHVCKVQESNPAIALKQVAAGEYAAVKDQLSCAHRLIEQLYSAGRPGHDDQVGRKQEEKKDRRCEPHKLM